MTGVIRPSVDRVVKNIVKSYNILQKSGHEIEFNVFPYRDDLESHMIAAVPAFASCRFLDPIPEQISKKPVLVNSYRMTKSIELSHKSVKDFKGFDLAIRHRIDYEINYIRIPEKINPNTWYGAYSCPSSVFDNFGMCSPVLFEKVWNSTRKDWFRGFNNEHILTNRLRALGAKICVSDFDVAGYQTKDKEWKGVPQWSKKNRGWSSRKEYKKIQGLSFD